MRNQSNSVVSRVAYWVALICFLSDKVVQFLSKEGHWAMRAIAPILAAFVAYWLLTACFQGSRPIAWLLVVLTPIALAGTALWIGWRDGTAYFDTRIGLQIIANVAALILAVSTLRTQIKHDNSQYD